MSIKVYNGFRFTTNDFVEIHNHLMAWRAELDRRHLESLAKLMANLAVSFLDEATVFPEEFARGRAKAEHKTLSPFLHAECTVLKLQQMVRAEHRRIPFIDFEFYVTLIPFEGRVYGMVVTEQGEWQDLWRQQPFVEEFGYWDNVDPLEDVDEADWNERGRIWEAILAVNPSAPPSMLGFSADCTRESVYVSLDDVMQHIQPPEERAGACADHAVRVRRRQHEIEQIDASNRTEAALDAAKRRADAWMRTDAGLAALAAETERMKTVLKPIRRLDLIDDVAVIPLPEPPEDAAAVMPG